MGHKVNGEGAKSITIGSSGSVAEDESSIAIGTYVISRDENSIVIGRDSYTQRQGTEGNSVRNSIVIGTESASSAEEGIVLGYTSKVNAPRAIAQGSNAHALADDAIALGTTTRATGVNSIAQGTRAAASAIDSQAIGTEAKAFAERGIAIGQKAKSGYDTPIPDEQERLYDSIAMGTKAHAKYENSIAIGTEAKALEENALAIGNAAKASAKDSIATGTRAVASAQDAIATGRDAAASAQEAIATGTGAKALGLRSFATGSGSEAAGLRAIAQGYQAIASGQDGIAQGYGAKAIGVDATAIGRSAEANLDLSLVLGQGAQALNGIAGGVALGAGSETGPKHGDDNSTYTVSDSFTAQGKKDGTTRVVSVGRVGEERQIINVAPGVISSSSTDAINGSQLYATNTYLTNLAKGVAVSLGGGSTVNEDGTVSAPSYTVGNADTVVNNVGDALNILNQGWTLTAEGNDTQVQAGDKVSLVNDDQNIVITHAADSGTVAFNLSDNIQVGKSITIGGDTNNQTVINQGGITTNTVTATSVTTNNFDAGGGTMVVNEGSVAIAENTHIDMGGNRITNVAPGVDGTDVVNMNQLGTVANSLSRDIRRVDREARAGTASAAAMANLPQAYLPGKSMFAVAGAGHRGESGYAAGLSTVSDNGKWVIKGSVAGNSRGDVTYGAGVGYQW